MQPLSMTEKNVTAGYCSSYGSSPTTL